MFVSTMLVSSNLHLFSVSLPAVFADKGMPYCLPCIISAIFYCSRKTKCFPNPICLCLLCCKVRNLKKGFWRFAIKFRWLGFKWSIILSITWLEEIVKICPHLTGYLIFKCLANHDGFILSSDISRKLCS